MRLSLLVSIIGVAFFISIQSHGALLLEGGPESLKAASIYGDEGGSIPTATSSRVCI
jgi:hypothetical protein